MNDPPQSARRRALLRGLWAVVRVRFILFGALGLAVFFFSDGVSALWRGRLLGPVLAPARLGDHPHALVLGDGRAVDYGAWAAWLVARGFDPHDLGGAFLALGVLGALGLFFFLKGRALGWAQLVGLAVFGAVRLDGNPLVVALLVVLLLPGTIALLGPPPDDARTET